MAITDVKEFQKSLIPLQKSLREAVPLLFFDTAFQEKLNKLAKLERDICKRNVEDFKTNSEYRSAHRKMCEKLGEHGWVVSSTCTPNTPSVWIAEIKGSTDASN